MSRSLSSWLRRGLLGLALSAGFANVACDQTQRGEIEVAYTVGDVVAIHEEVRVGDRLVSGQLRVSQGETISTGPEGRARLILDGGATIAVDGDTTLKLEDGKLRLEAGRAFVRAEEEPLLVEWGQAKAKVASSAVAFDLSQASAWRAYCANGEMALEADSQRHRVQGGETASLEKGAVRVLPEKAFEDWTGGLAEPQRSVIEGKSTVPLVRARSGRGEAGQALTIRSHQVDAKIVGEVAITKSRTTYFNGSDTSGEAHVRLALPDGAILTRVSLQHGKDGSEEYASVEIAAGPSRSPGFEAYGLEWAGGGWLQGILGRVGAGEILNLSLEYAEWLPTRSGKATYRYATSTDSAQSAVGDLAIRVNAQETKTRSLSVSSGAEVKRRSVTYRAADERLRGDFVVELAPKSVVEGEGRIYVQRTGAQKKDAYVFVRTEIPERKLDGVTLAVVVDTSQSVGAATLETSLSVVDTILGSLGPKDSLVVLAADEKTRVLGSGKPEAVDAKLKAKLHQELAALRPGGASNLSQALLVASDLLDAQEGGHEGMVIYVGDGRPTVGAPDVRTIRRVLAARPGGMPRLGAIAVGPTANRWLLSQLVSSAGTVAQVFDREDAARASAQLLADALTPRFREVGLDLGPHVDRIYPRDAQIVTAGATVSVVGRLRGPVPSKVVLSYRDGAELKSVQRVVKRLSVPPGGDLSRQWARARVAQIAREGEGIEPAIAIAHEYGLVTPWTSWLFGAPPDQSGTAPFATRILELSNSLDSSWARHVDPVLTTGSSLIEPNAPQGRHGSLVDAAEAAMRRMISQAARSVRACRDAQAAKNPEVGNSFSMRVAIDGDGTTTEVKIVTLNSRRRDPALERCIEGVVKSLPYIGIGKKVSIEHELTLTGGRSLRPTQCSEASKVSLPVRREIWRSRSPSSAEDYERASQLCELRKWSDRQQFLLLMLENVRSGETRLELAEALYRAGQADAAQFVRDQTLRSVQTFEEIQRLMQILRADEPDIGPELEEELKKAQSNEEGLKICRKFLRLAPHNTYARRRLLSYLEVLGKNESVVSSVRKWRGEAVSDAGLLADGASALMRLDLIEEGRRAFGELIERAPRDPWTLAFVGDRLRAEGLYDEAGTAYESLARLLPGDAGVTLRQALAHAGAGRVDVASRLLQRVAQTGGRDDDGRLAELAEITQATILAAARGGKDAQVEAELERRLLRTSLPDAQAIILVRAAPKAHPVRLELRRQEGETLPLSAAMDARQLGLAAARVERGESGEVTLALIRDEVAGPSHPVDATVSLLRLGPAGTVPELQMKTVQVPANGDSVKLKVKEGRFL